MKDKDFIKPNKKNNQDIPSNIRNKVNDIKIGLDLIKNRKYDEAEMIYRNLIKKRD